MNRRVKLFYPEFGKKRGLDEGCRVVNSMNGTFGLTIFFEMYKSVKNEH